MFTILSDGIIQQKNAKIKGEIVNFIGQIDHFIRGVVGGALYDVVFPDKSKKVLTNMPSWAIMCKHACESVGMVDNHV